MYRCFNISNRLIIFHLYIGKGKPFQSWKSGAKRSKVKVKVNQNVQNTFLAITPVLIKIETPNKNHFVPLREPYHMWPWPWPLTLTLFLAPKVKVDLVWPFFDFLYFDYTNRWPLGSFNIDPNLSWFGPIVFEKIDLEILTKGQLLISQCKSAR